MRRTLVAAALAATCSLVPLTAAQAAAPDGSIDGSWGWKGRIAPYGSSSSSTFLMARQGTSLLLVDEQQVPGSSTTQLVVQRRTADGRSDTAFGTRTTALPMSGALRQVVALPGGGSAVLLDLVTPDTYEQLVGVLRLLPDGTADPAFGDQGLTVVDLRAEGLIPAGLVAQPDGHLLVGLSQFAGGSDLALLRLDASGTWDRTYGTDGVERVDVGDDSTLTGLVAAPGGRAIAVGSSASSEAQRAVVARFGPDGLPDASFGTGGALVFGSGHIALGGATALPDGSVVVTGGAYLAPGYASLAARITPRGSLDERFGDHGVREVEVTGQESGYGDPVVVGGRLVMAQVLGEGPFRGRLVALDPVTGRRRNGFGTSGAIQLGSVVPRQILPDGTGFLVSVLDTDHDPQPMYVQRRL